jgi:hypothetical protein
MAELPTPAMPIVLDIDELRSFAQRLRETSPAAWRAYRKEALAIGNEMLAEAKQRAAFSPKIAASGRVTVQANGNVVVKFGGPDAWWVVPIENRGRGNVSHPTFGHEPITDLNSHAAILHPVFVQNRDRYVNRIRAALHTAVQQAVSGEV